MIDVTRLLPNIVRANPELAVKMAWARAAGDGLRRNTHPFSFAGKTLTVSVADALWQKQLQSMSAELVFRMNNLLGRGTVVRRRFDCRRRFAREILARRQ